jgi:eukaryotic-like serine/threonine-protein kinase
VGVGHANSDEIPDAFGTGPRNDAARARMTSPQPGPLVGGDPHQVGRFTILGLLGEGGMGRVFLGCSPGGRAVAIKIIRSALASDPAFRTRFTHEIAAARAVGGFYTAPVVDADTTGPQPWLAVAYVAGPSLLDAVVASGPLPPPAIRQLGLGLAEALQAIHAAGVVHRDMKPSNVLLAADGPRVIDFGIARAAESSSVTRTGTIVGSAGFMAPEQITGGDVGPATDVFALGAVLTFAATGQGPFGEGRTEALAYRVVYGDPMLDNLPEPPRGMVERCLAKDPRQRPDPAEVIAALAAIPAAVTATGKGWLPEPVERMVGQHQAIETAAMGMLAVPPTQPPREDVTTPTMTSYRPPEYHPAGYQPAGYQPAGYQPAGYQPAGYQPAGYQPAGAVPAGPAPAPAPAPAPSATPPPARRPRGWILAAVALGVVLAVAGFVAANRLSAKTPAPPVSTTRPLAASPAPTSHPAPSATPSPSGTGSAGLAGSGPAAVVLAYYSAINNHDCGTAWSLGGSNISAANGQTYQQFCQGFSTTTRDVVTVDSVAGDTVAVTIVAEHTDGSAQTFQGSYVVSNGVIDSASVQQSG